VVTIFVGFLLHMAKMILGAPTEAAPRGGECPWKLAAMLLVAAVILTFGFWIPMPIVNLVSQSAHILGASQ
jgi:hypothetical protein